MKRPCVIVVPIYTLELTCSEKTGLLHCIERLKDYDVFFVHKQSISAASIFHCLSLSEVQAHSCRSAAIADAWLRSTGTYSSLLFQGWFYRIFEEWEYMLIFQQDAWVLGTGEDLAQWINKGYTYIGAPWTGHLGPDTPDKGVGNGGFSLRHVGAMIRICESVKTSCVPVFRWQKLAYRMTLFRRYHLFPLSQWPLIFCKRFVVFVAMSFGWNNTLAYFSKIAGTQEDHLISLFAPLVFPWMRIPSMAEAAAFSVETNPRETCAHYQVQRPFGCHAWSKHDREFWLATYPEEFSSLSGCEE